MWSLSTTDSHIIRRRRRSGLYLDLDSMPRPRPPFLLREVTRHGGVKWYVRVGKGPRIRVPAPGTSEFDAEYAAARSGEPKRSKGAPVAGSLSWLVARYRETTAWTNLSMATRGQRENIFRQVIGTAGEEPISKITTASLERGRDRRSPHQGRHFLDAMRGLFRWAAKAKLAKDPTIGIEDPARPKSDGFRPWSEEDVAAYHKRWPIGTRQRVWLDVLLYTGLRRGDAVQLGRQHVRDGVASLKTEKNDTPVMLPILPALAATLKAGPCADLTFIAGENGRPLTKESFGNLFREACTRAGVRASAHGVRKLAAATMANNGATEAQLEAVFGWRGGRMASLYTRSANRRLLAQSSMHMLMNEERTDCPAPSGGVRGKERKA
jgi:integrase